MRILSGVFADDDGRRQVTTGTPISLMIENVDQRSKDYSEIATATGPGHADYTYDAKYGMRDYRGGGRSSARETAARVAAGAIARKVVAGRDDPRRAGADRPARRSTARAGTGTRSSDNPFFCPDAETVAVWESYLDDIRKARLLDRRRHRGRRRGRARRAGARRSTASSTRNSPPR